MVVLSARSGSGVADTHADVERTVSGDIWFYGIDDRDVDNTRYSLVCGDCIAVTALDFRLPHALSIAARQYHLRMLPKVSAELGGILRECNVLIVTVLVIIRIRVGRIWKQCLEFQGCRLSGGEICVGAAFHLLVLPAAFSSRLLSEIGCSLPSRLSSLVGLTVYPLRVPSRSMMAVFLSPSLKAEMLTCCV